MTTYRPATDNQYDEFLSLMLDHMADYLENLMTLMEMTLEQFTEILRSVGQVYSINQGDEVSGFYWVEERGHDLHLHGLILREKYQGQGIGSQILAMLEEQYGSSKELIELGVRMTNERAIKLYEKSGYQIVKTLDELGYYIMQKRLTGVHLGVSHG